MRRQCCLPMTENPEASVLTSKRASQHVRLSRANDAYEHLCILTLLPSLAPLHLMLADTPWPHGFGATLTNVGPLSEGFKRSVASPLQPRRLRAMGRTVRSISSLSDNHSNSFQVAVRFARQIGIGAAVTRRPLPHHRAYGSVHGGSSWLRYHPSINVGSPSDLKLHLLPKSFVRIRHFGFLANRRRASLLPLCFAALHATPPKNESETSTAPTAHPLWRCPKCGGPMAVVERFTAAQLQLRSPPLLATAA